MMTSFKLFNLSGKLSPKVIFFVLILASILTVCRFFSAQNIMPNLNTMPKNTMPNTMPKKKYYAKEKVEISKNLCNEILFVNITQLDNFLKTFYSKSKLYYGQYLEKSNSQLEDDYKTLPKLCLNNVLVDVGVENSNYIPLKQYRINKLNNFKDKSNLLPLKRNLCGGKRCKLRPFNNQPVNHKIVKNPKNFVDEKAVSTELEALRSSGFSHGDDDLQSLDFIKEYFSSFKNSSFKVPNLVHYVWFSCHHYGISEYLCMLSALKFQKPDYILVHGDCEPKGTYWQLFKQAAGDKLKLVKKTPPEKIFGSKITALEHKSDVARMQIMLQTGGMYFDTDTMVLKSMDDLRRGSDIVLGKANPVSLANGGILANKNSWFLKKWFQEYQSFVATDGPSPKAGEWGKNSVQVPFVLWKLFPDKIRVIELYMFRPSSDVHLLYDGLIDWSNHWTIHLSTRNMPDVDKRRTFGQFALLETTYGELARHVLWGDSSVKDVTPWLLHPDFDKL